MPTPRSSSSMSQPLIATISNGITLSPATSLRPHAGRCRHRFQSAQVPQIGRPGERLRSRALASSKIRSRNAGCEHTDDRADGSRGRGGRRCGHPRPRPRRYVQHLLSANDGARPPSDGQARPPRFRPLAFGLRAAVDREAHRPSHRHGSNSRHSAGGARWPFDGDDRLPAYGRPGPANWSRDSSSSGRSTSRRPRRAMPFATGRRRSGRKACRRSSMPSSAPHFASETQQKRLSTVAFVRESVMRQDPEGYAATCEAMVEARGIDLARIRCPVVLIAGDEDAVAPQSAVQMMRERLRNASATVLAKCGHWTTIEKPEECNTALREFLARTGPERRQKGDMPLAEETRTVTRLTPSSSTSSYRNGNDHIVFTNVRVLDGSGEYPFTGEVVVQGNRSSTSAGACGPSHSWRDRYRRRRCDRHAGLIDAHLHLSWNNAPGIEPIQMMPPRSISSSPPRWRSSCSKLASPRGGVLRRRNRGSTSSSAISSMRQGAGPALYRAPA